ncbi:hypothetical protein KC343_g131 [Hortaea werneckii]|nr:hypothetical protein KC352_g1241 [Hortaea werneckii]KAI7573128.1 hypothetical protein KC317_g151 [Hortaea werneckii]KAI7628530.1 hypothetical protein KC346_g127 [Hortaea werneckii]KAI7638361.1 hypothetical protein KC343_g131 [Hortaea werneckii]KAI7683988.1 hypothetical protein KC319_g158 [Hortaea werneckii]
MADLPSNSLDAMRDAKRDILAALSTERTENEKQSRAVLRFKHENDEYRRTILRLQQEDERHRNTNSRLQEENEAHLRTVNRLQGESQEHYQTISRLQQDNEEHLRTVKGLQEESENQQRTISLLQQDNKAYRSWNTYLEEENDTNIKKISDLELQCLTLPQRQDQERDLITKDAAESQDLLVTNHLAAAQHGPAYKIGCQTAQYPAQLSAFQSSSIQRGGRALGTREGPSQGMSRSTGKKRPRSPSTETGIPMHVDAGGYDNHEAAEMSASGTLRPQFPLPTEDFATPAWTYARDDDSDEPAQATTSRSRMRHSPSSVDDYSRDDNSVDPADIPSFEKLGSDSPAADSDGNDSWSPSWASETSETSTPFPFKVFLGSFRDENDPSTAIVVDHNSVSPELLQAVIEQTRTWPKVAASKHKLTWAQVENAPWQCVYNKAHNQGPCRWTKELPRFYTCMRCANTKRFCFRKHGDDVWLLPLPGSVDGGADVKSLGSFLITDGRGKAAMIEHRDVWFKDRTHE